MLRGPPMDLVVASNQGAESHMSDHRLIFKFLASTLLFAGLSVAPANTKHAVAQDTCDFSDVRGVVWWGTEREMTMEQFVSYIAPMYWFSPDEPSLYRREGREIMAPEPFPFEEADGPVAYYQMKEMTAFPGYVESSVIMNDDDKNLSVVDLETIILARIDIYAYFAEEAGLGAHDHDVEATEFKVVILRSDGDYLPEASAAQCDERNYVILVTRVSGKAHGIEWFWNIVETDVETKFPMSILVEEGKHAMATDKNADGYFTPSYDVNVRVNDAWGVRDIIRSGGLFTGGYEAWMTKVRQPGDRVMPPLPEDSPWYDRLQRRQDSYTEGNAVYELRPFPSDAEAQAWDAAHPDDHKLAPFLADKQVPDWPERDEAESLEKLQQWIDDGIAKKSFAVNLYADGNLGLSWAFPFFVVKNLEVPMSGGYVLHRMYYTFSNASGDSFGWMALYTNSASRWIDGYFSAGAEWQYAGATSGEDRVDFVLETGFKFRAQIGHSPLKFLSFFTDFWGFRAGIKNYGFFDIDRLTYVLEIGAGSF